MIESKPPGGLPGIENKPSAAGTRVDASPAVEKSWNTVRNPDVPRFLALFIFVLLGAGISSLAFPASPPIGRGVLPGGLLGFLAWLFYDGWQARRLLDWLGRLQKSSAALAATPLPARLPHFWREIAERMERLLRQQQRALQKQRLLTENLVDALQASPNGVIMLDAARGIEWMNLSASRHFGLDERHDVGQAITHLIRDPVFVACLASRDFANSINSIVLTSPCSNAHRPLRLSLRLCPYGADRLLLLSQDITQIEQAEAMRRDFIANVSHELRTPLTVLAGFVETLQTLPLGEDQRQDYLARMERHALRMQTLVADLLVLSRLEDSPPPGLAPWTPAHTLLAACAAEARALSELLARETKTKTHRLHFPETHGLGEIAGNAQELQSAFINLVGNAIRHTPPGSRVDVLWQNNADGSATFAVRDDGPGIAPEHLPRITERFYRVDSGLSRESGGTGLGLSIVKHVLQRHGATLDIDSAPGQGACFSATFPAARVRAQAALPPGAGPREA